MNQVKFQDLDSNFPRLNGTPSSGLSGFYTQEKATLRRSGRMRLPAINDNRKKKHFRGTSSLDNCKFRMEKMK